MQSANHPKPAPVTFRFKNIGPVKEADMELGDLTIIAGRNNTGKTYLAYTLYGFLKTWRELAASVPEECDDLVQTAIKTGYAKHPIDRESLDQARKTMMERTAKDFSEKVLSDVFSCSDATFEKASLKIVLNDVFPREIPPQKEGDFSIAYDGSHIVIDQEGLLKNDAPLSTSSRTVSIIYKLYMSLLSPNFPHPFILSSERFGISIFYKELDFTKSQLVDMLQKSSDRREGRIDPFFLLDKSVARYALPIKDNIDYTRGISDFRRQKSEIYGDKLFNNIKDMMDGYYRSSGDDIEFRSKARGNRKFNIPLHIASSSARGLSDLYFYLRHLARKNHLLIIDEPESHLHPSCQILMARLIVACINAGIKVLVTTHSDYFVKEINNLIMLSNDFYGREEFLYRHRKHYSKDDFLKPESVRAYICEEGTLSPCTIDERGIEMASFDDTIDEINRISNELATRIEADGQT